MVIELIVSDVNDEVPVFQNLPYNVDLSEVAHVVLLLTETVVKPAFCVWLSLPVCKESLKWVHLPKSNMAQLLP